MAYAVARGVLRRTAKADASDTERATTLNAAAADPASLGLVLGVVAGGELLLELPPLRESWWAVVPLAALATRMAMTALWMSRVLPEIARLEGDPTPADERLASSLRYVLVALVPRYGVAVVVGFLLARETSGIGLAVALAAYVGALAVVSPLLVRLGQRTRVPTAGELERVRALSTRYRLGVDTVRIGAQGGAAMVSGVGRGSVVFVGERLLALPDDELAAVIAHEAAHRDHHHLAVRTATRLATTIVVLAVAVTVLDRLSGDTAAFLVGVLVALVAAPYAIRLVGGSVEVVQEHAADRAAAEQVGAEPLARALTAMTSGEAGVPAYGWLTERRLGHPSPVTRIARLGAAAS